jgi:hypothetical protein
MGLALNTVKILKKHTLNPQITKTRKEIFKFIKLIINKDKLSMLVGISEAICVLLILFYFTQEFNHSIYQELHSIPIIPFNQWLAGLIDADGYFSYSKKGYVSFEITVELRDKRVLYLIKQKYGGSIKMKSGQNFIRYRLHHKEGLLKLIHDINGEIRNPIRILQFLRLCNKYSCNFIYPKPLTYNNYWLSGFIDGDGSIYLNLLSDQLFITATNKNKLLLDPLISLYGGSINTSNLKGPCFKWMIYKKLEIEKMLFYFEKYPLKSKKNNRILLISQYFHLRKIKAHLAVIHSPLNKSWLLFLKKWQNYN